jgi:hypothetical protein
VAAGIMRNPPDGNGSRIHYSEKFFAGIAKFFQTLNMKMEKIDANDLTKYMRIMFFHPPKAGALMATKHRTESIATIIAACMFITAVATKVCLRTKFANTEL